MRGLVVRAEWSPKALYRLTKWETRLRRSLRGNMVWRNPTWRIETIAEPTVGQHDVLVKVGACGVCGSDVSMLQVEDDQYIAYASECTFPCVIGHELAGEIVEVGHVVKNLRPGDIVYIEEKQWCGRCDYCRAGDFGQCVNREELGFTIDGGYADYIAVEDRFCWNLAPLFKAYSNREEVIEAGALLEPLGDVYQGIITSAGGFQPGGHVVVFGAGPIGLAAMALAKAMGAGEIIVFEPEEPRRRLARMLGIDHVEDPFADLDVSPAQVIMELTDGKGAAMLIEAAGEFVQSLPWMEQALAVRGKIVLLGLRPGYPRIDPLTYQILDGSLYGCHGHPGHGNTLHTINLLAAKRIDLRPIITNEYGLNDAIEAIYRAADKSEGKVLVKPGKDILSPKEAVQSTTVVVK